MELIDQPTEQISTIFLILISFAFPSTLSDGQILIKLLAKNTDQNKVMCFKCFNDDCETAYIDSIAGPAAVFLSSKKLYYFEILTGKTLIDCEVQWLAVRQGGSTLAVLVATGEPSQL